MAIVRTVFLAVFSFLILSSPLFAENHFPSLAEVTSPNVNLRAGQNANFEKLGKLPQGSTVVVVAESYGWYKIKAPASSLCFISRKYVNVLTDGRGVVTGHKVNLRAAANVNAAAIGQLTKDTIVKIIATKDDFYQIEPVEGVYGWALTQFLSLKSGTVPPAQALEKYTPSVVVVVKKEEDVKLNISGRLEKSSDGTHYSVVLADGSQYSIDAPSAVLVSFLNYQVKLQGIQERNSSTSTATIHPNRVELLL